MKSYFLAVVVLLCLPVPAAAETLNNDTVIALAGAGLGDQAIIAKIQSSETQFDVSTTTILQLKAKGVSGPIIAAMIEAGRPKVSTTLSVDAADPMIPHAPGVYLMSESASDPKMIRMDATVSNQAKTGGILGYAFTGGIASMSVKAAIQNETARTKADGTPTFYFFFDESNPDTGRQAATWLAGTAATVTSPAEFTLVELMKKKGRREARVGSMNIGGAKSGVMDKDRIGFDYTLVRPGVFSVKPTTALPKGEYGFLYAINGGGAGGAMTARIYDFTVQ
ncbi:hypothetical protein [Sphingomonas sanxanigenens]|uniref:Uncharacterized protein n=1 Tax=Sphingomonas sanxanigenens DSM 19645 = NX02 TaxID=1123269 RepID=W0AG73_9SPHN|nr:hypothetical protein [Sphingomonas sanxanigenens]AHE56106.1 hypothetical protein NX02_22435 [Sphingomonas sanxanigenens DSM 19645 = NX02]